MLEFRFQEIIMNNIGNLLNTKKIYMFMELESMEEQYFHIL